MEENNLVIMVEMEDGTYGTVKKLGAHFSIVAFERDGHRYEVAVPTEDLEIIEHVSISHREI